MADRQGHLDEPVHVVTTHMNKTRITAALMLTLACGVAPQVVLAQAGIKRTDLQRNDLSVPGREVVQVRVDIAPGVMFPRHSHPGEEIVYMIEGSLEYRLDGRPPITLNAGDVLFIPAGAIHAVKNLGTSNGAELATYLVEKGKPLLALAQ